MTALLTLERANLDDSSRPPTTGRARRVPDRAEPGERLTVRDLLRGLLVCSGNDAAMTLATGVAGSEQAFVRR